MAKISKKTVDDLTTSGAQPSFLWDEHLIGFAVKALHSGTKRYLVKYRISGGGRAAAQRWLTLGSHGQITPEQARALAQQALAAVARGEDPQSAKFKLRRAPSLNDVWIRFESEHLPLKKPATCNDYRSQWTNLIEPRFGKSRVEEVSRGDVEKFHKGMRDTPYRANRTLALFSHLMTLAEGWDWRIQGTNPCKHVVRFKEKSRTRYLSADELTGLGNALKELTEEGAVSRTAANAIELLLLTGARLNEVLKSQWTWLDKAQSVLNLPDSKTGAKPVFLGQAALDVLDDQKTICGSSAYVFASSCGQKPIVNLRKIWVRVCQRAGIDGVRLHDLRHTAASIAVGQGASLAVIGRLLGHTQTQTTQRYAHVDFDPALKVANSVGTVVRAAFGDGRR